MQFKIKRRATPREGMYFVYINTVFKIIKIKVDEIWVAWYDEKLDKVFTNNLSKNGMKIDTWRKAIVNQKYKIIYPKDFIDTYVWGISSKLIEFNL